MDAEKIRQRLELNEIAYREELPEKLAVYHALLRDWNNRMDLTAVSEDNEMIDRHFIDSLTVLKTGLIPEEAKLIDVGTGAGFPGLVLAMAVPGLEVTLLDGLQKRLSFIEAVCRETRTDSVTLIHARAEDGARKAELREYFDIAVARALAPANVLCEYLLPYVRIGGLALCWKGPALLNELPSGKKAAHLLGGRMEQPVSCPVFGQEWEHSILPITKMQSTPTCYPRKAGLPKKQPLGEQKEE